MAIEKNLLSADYAYLTDSTGDYVTVSDAPAGPLITRRAPLTTPRASLTSHDRHVLQSSTGNTVIARSLDTDIFARGGTAPLTTPRASLYARRDSLIVDTTRTILPGIYGTTRFGYSSYSLPLDAGQYGSSDYGQSSYA